MIVDPALKLSPDSTSPNHEVIIRTKHERVVSTTNTIIQGIKLAATSRVLNRMASKISTEIAAKTPLTSAKLGSELLSSSEYEISSTVENTLSQEVSHFIEETTEQEQTITLKPTANDFIAHLRRIYWPHRWNFYLHSYEYMELTYKKKWKWLDTRKTIIEIEPRLLGWPLVSAVFYEPQKFKDVSFHPEPEELPDPEKMEAEALEGRMPQSEEPSWTQIRASAKIAFPETWTEKRFARRVRKAGTKKAASRKAPMKITAKKAPARRATTKKSIAKKSTAKKATAKKATAKKATAKKSIAKRSAARRTAAR